MKEFIIYLENKPGKLAFVCETLANAAVNIEAISTDSAGDKGLIHIVTNDRETTVSLLKSKHMDFEEKDIFSIKLPDRPGELAKIARKLANANINIDSIYILGKENSVTHVAITPSKLSDAERLLRNYL